MQSITEVERNSELIQVRCARFTAQINPVFFIREAHAEFGIDIPTQTNADVVFESIIGVGRFIRSADIAVPRIVPAAGLLTGIRQIGVNEAPTEARAYVGR